jgi:hypothetical protein
MDIIHYMNVIHGIDLPALEEKPHLTMVDSPPLGPLTIQPRCTSSQRPFHHPER